MKKWFLLIISFISITWVYAENVSVDQAMQVAMNFSQQIPGNQLRSGQTESDSDIIDEITGQMKLFDE